MSKVAFKKSENSLKRIIYCEVYAPGRPDSGKDFATAEEIEKMAHQFLRSGATKQIDMEHNHELVPDCAVVESFIAREGDPEFIPGSWVVGIHIPNDEVWALVESGEINGVSMDALAIATDVEAEINVPSRITGRTSVTEDHDHMFTVEMDDELNLAGGRTSTAGDGHFHLIRGGTVTEEANGHTHRFAFIDEVLVVSDDEDDSDD